jgi:hypothetical protein
MAGWEAAAMPVAAVEKEAEAGGVAPAAAEVGLEMVAGVRTSLTARTTPVAGWAAAPALAEKEARAEAETAGVVVKVPPSHSVA